MKRLRLYNLEVALDAGEKALYRAALRRLNLDAAKVSRIELTKRALDARGGKVQWNCTADVDILPKFADDVVARVADWRNVVETPVTPPLEFPMGTAPLRGRVVIVGSGPGGLFAGYVLAKQGYRPLIVERGAPALERLRAIGRFNNAGGELRSDANAMFGEGGAGTFSDGKLYTRKNKDPHLTNVLQLFVEHGAPKDILIDAAPHIGTDKLAPVVTNIRKRIEELGGEVRFLARMENIETDDGVLRAVTVNGERIECAACILAAGHSARDTYEMLRNAGVAMEAKAFQFGVRIEHPQEFVNELQYKRQAGHPKLGPAEYFLTCSANPELGEVHSFCMCPGGIIVPAVTDEGELNLNGMSFSLRANKWANAGLVTTLGPADFGGSERNPLAGIAFQRRMERAMFDAGGGDFVCPAQPAADFLTGLNITRELQGSYPRGRRYVELAKLLPERVVKALKYALTRFDRSMPGFASAQGILHAPEARASSPVRIARNPDTRESLNVRGLYPVGEGAGYAGGIMSAALDGIHSAAAVMAVHAPIA